MAAYTLILGNKNYSSWSMRAGVVAYHLGLDADEVVIPLDQPETKAAIAEHSPSGLVPVLKRDGLCVWDSLAISETLAEAFPDAGLWPAAADARAVARAVSAEMHSGFQALRMNMAMNIRASLPGRGRTPEVADDVARIAAIWRDCRARFGAGGPFLFGGFGIADAMYAPVATRFRTYGVALDAVGEAYSEALFAHPAIARWCADAAAEPWAYPKYD